MSSCERRQAIARFASIELVAATYLRDSADTPDVKAAAQWVADRLREIEPFFLEKADGAADPWGQRWLNAAERWLDFYTTELRRLQDREGDAAFDGITWTTMH